MVHVWHRVGDNRSTEAVYADLCQRMRAAGGTIAVPCSEEANSAMTAELSRIEAKLATPEPSPTFQAAMADLRSYVTRYVTAYAEIIDQQKALNRFRLVSEDFKVNERLFDAPEKPQAAINRVLGCRLPVDGHPHTANLPPLADAPEVKKATLAVHGAVQGIETLRDTLTEAIRLENLPLDQKNERMIQRLAARIGALEDRVLELETPTRRKRHG